MHVEGSVWPEKRDTHVWVSRTFLVSTVRVNVLVSRTFLVSRVLVYYRKLSLISCVLITYLLLSCLGGGSQMMTFSLIHTGLLLVSSVSIDGFLLWCTCPECIWRAIFFVFLISVIICGCIVCVVWGFVCETMMNFLCQSEIAPVHFLSWLP